MHLKLLYKRKSGAYSIETLFFTKNRRVPILSRHPVCTYIYMYIYIHIYIYVGGTFRVYVAILASRKMTTNIVRNGVHRYEMLYFLGTLQEPTVDTVKTRILWVCDVPSQILLAASKHCKTSCFPLLNPEKPKNCHIDPEGTTYIYIYIYAVRLGSGPSFAILKVRFWTNFVFRCLFFSPNRGVDGFWGPKKLTK